VLYATSFAHADHLTRHDSSCSSYCDTIVLCCSVAAAVAQIIYTGMADDCFYSKSVVSPTSRQRNATDGFVCNISTRQNVADRSVVSTANLSTANQKIKIYSKSVACWRNAADKSIVSPASLQQFRLIWFCLSYFDVICSKILYLV
jgi:hypothetical protein